MHPLTEKWLAHRDAIRSSRTRLGVEGYSHLCAILAEKPATVREFWLTTKLGRNAAYRFILSLHAMGWAHIVEWVNMPRTKPIPRFAFGPGQDAPAPTLRPNGRPVIAAPLPRRQLCPHLIAYVNILRALDEAPCTRAELVERVGLDKTVVRWALEAMMSLDIAHIGGWEVRPRGGEPIAVFHIGTGRTAKKPPKRDRQNVWLHKKRHLQMLHAMAGPLPMAA